MLIYFLYASSQEWQKEIHSDQDFHVMIVPWLAFLAMVKKAEPDFLVSLPMPMNQYTGPVVKTKRTVERKFVTWFGEIQFRFIPSKIIKQFKNTWMRLFFGQHSNYNFC